MGACLSSADTRATGAKSDRPLVPSVFLDPCVPTLVFAGPLLKAEFAEFLPIFAYMGAGPSSADRRAAVAKTDGSPAHRSIFSAPDRVPEIRPRVRAITVL